MTTLGKVSPTHRGAIRPNLLARHPLVSFFCIAVLGSWLTVLPVLLSKTGFGLLPITIPVEPLKTIASFTGPLLAAFWVTASTEGQPGVRSLLRSMINWRVGLGWLLLAVFGYVFMDLLVGTIVTGAAAPQGFFQNWPLIFTLYLPTLLTLRLISPVGEETGWTGFALPRLQEKFSPLLSAVILGGIWAIWHLPGFFMTGGDMAGFDPVGFVFFIINAIFTRIL